MVTRIRCEVRDESPVTVVRLAGALDLGTMRAVHEVLDSCLAAQPDALVVDLEEIEVGEPLALSVFAAAARRAAPVQEVDDGQQQRRDDRRQCHRHHQDLQPQHHPQHRDHRSEEHQQAPRPCGGAADDGADRLVGERVKGRTSRHSGSVTALRCRALDLRFL